MPAILRSELEIEPDGLLKDMMDWQMSSGHCMCQIMGDRGQTPVNQMLPTLREEVLQKPM